MNEQMQKFARNEIKAGLAKLPDGHQRMFKRMYSHGGMEKPIEQIVDDMPAGKLDWAMEQVERSLQKLRAQQEKG